jgi:hypothetical protein
VRNSSSPKRGDSESQKFVQSQIDALISAYHGMSWDDGQVRLYKGILSELAALYGPARTGKAVSACILNETFLEPAKLKQHLPAAEVERKRCASCAATEGWLYVTLPGETSARVKRCLHTA